MIFEKNRVLFKESPFACVVKLNFLDSTCSNCFKRNIKLFKCGQCLRNYYCSRECQKSDWKLHKLECKFFASKINISTFDSSLLMLRIICKVKNKCSQDKDYLTMNKIGFIPRCFDNLATNKYDRGSKFSQGFTLIMTTLHNILNTIEVDMANFVSWDLAREIFEKIITNNFNITDESNYTIGEACYLNASGLNHSCWPNAVYAFEGNQLVMTAIKAVDSGDELFVNYIETLQLRVDRRRHLREQYKFECQCEACMNDELDREMEQLYCENGDCKGSVLRIIGTDKFQCNECSVMVPENVMTKRHSDFKNKLERFDKLMYEKNYKEVYAMARHELQYFHLDCQPTDAGGVVQTIFAQRAFDSAMFLHDLPGAMYICRMKKRQQNWIQERLIRFLGTDARPSVSMFTKTYQFLLSIM